MIYIAGPVTGYEDDNRAAFEEAREEIATASVQAFGLGLDSNDGRLRAAALRSVCIPHELVPKGVTWEEAMRVCIRQLTYADKLVYLPGSQDSRGAKLEMKIARALGTPVYSLEQYLKHLERFRE